MNSVRINISMPKDTFEELSREAGPRERSRFVTEATRRLLRERRDQRLAEEYKEAAAEINEVNLDLEGVLSDGID